MIRVVRASAGCGKTTDLACRYLEFLADGVPADRAVAITFTRRAAAELTSRVTLALRACSGDEEARARLGGAWPRYEAAAPDDPALVQRALEDLGDAPIGTTDSFIGMLLGEFALDAALPVPQTDEQIPLDLPLMPRAGLDELLEQEARRLLDPADGRALPEVERLARYYRLGDLLPLLTWRSDYDHLPVGSCSVVLKAVGQACAQVMADFDLAEMYRVAPGAGREDWRQALYDQTNQQGQWAAHRIADWIVDGMDLEDTPYELVGWLRGLNLRSGARKALRDRLKTTRFHFGVAQLTLWQITLALRYPYEEESHVHLADQLRDDLESLRARVVQAGLREAAARGVLGHDQLLDAAIYLVQDPPQGLLERFDALLVDEVQDANLGQHRLYRTMASWEGMRSYFVGDARQSIYLFRGGEPMGFRGLAAFAKNEGGGVEDLDVNFRSTPPLVHAHTALFESLEPGLGREELRPLQSLSGVAPHPPLADNVLSAEHHDDPRPVHLVHGKERTKTRDLDDATLSVFLERVRQAWSEPGHEGDTAVVLTPTWWLAKRSCEMLRELADDESVAFVDGGRWEGRRVCEDLVLILRALTDRYDDVAWLGFLKHPMIGLSDAALARIRASVGLVSHAHGREEPAPPWTRALGWAIGADALGEAHSPEDRRAFARAVGPVRDALDRIGREPTGRVLESLATALHWRGILAAGPGGRDDLAELEVLLEWVRGLDRDGAGPDQVLSVLGEPGSLEPPRLHLDRGPQHITCGTSFSAKGLAWDHVCVLSVGKAPRRQSWDGETTWARLGSQKAVRLVGLKFDPVGALSPYKDPIARLSARILERRHDEELVRLAYVSITRARRSVTVAVPDAGAKYIGRVQQIIGSAWRRVEADGIAHRKAPDVTIERTPPLGWARPGPQAPALPDPREAHWFEDAPSRVAARLGPDRRAQQASWIRNQVILGQGLTTGRSLLHVPTGPRYDELHVTTWGELAHGWFARWRFEGEPSPELARDYLQTEWQTDDAPLAAWLVRLAERLIDQGGPMWDAVQSARHLHFEWPLVGTHGDLLLSGRIDLLVEKANGHLQVIDFKAGEKAPTGSADLVKGASLLTYGPQLEAYRRVLQNMGRQVDSVGLWFVRTGAQVQW